MADNESIRFTLKEKEGMHDEYDSDKELLDNVLTNVLTGYNDVNDNIIDNGNNENIAISSATQKNTSFTRENLMDDNESKEDTDVEITDNLLIIDTQIQNNNEGKDFTPKLTKSTIYAKPSPTRTVTRTRTSTRTYTNKVVQTPYNKAIPNNNKNIPNNVSNNISNRNNIPNNNNISNTNKITVSNSIPNSVPQIQPAIPRDNNINIQKNNGNNEQVNSASSLNGSQENISANEPLPLENTSDNNNNSTVGIIANNNYYATTNNNIESNLTTDNSKLESKEANSTFVIVLTLVPILVVAAVAAVFLIKKYKKNKDTNVYPDDKIRKSTLFGTLQFWNANKINRVSVSSDSRGSRTNLTSISNDRESNVPEYSEWLEAGGSNTLSMQATSPPVSPRQLVTDGRVNGLVSSNFAMGGNINDMNNMNNGTLTSQQINRPQAAKYAWKLEGMRVGTRESQRKSERQSLFNSFQVW